MLQKDNSSLRFALSLLCLLSVLFTNDKNLTKHCILADVVMSFATIVVRSGRIKNLHVLVRCGRKTIFCMMMTGILMMMMMMKMKMQNGIPTRMRIICSEQHTNNIYSVNTCLFSDWILSAHDGKS